MRSRTLALFRVTLFSIMGLLSACALQEAPPARPVPAVRERPGVSKPVGPGFYLPVLALGGREPYLIWASLEGRNGSGVFLSRSGTDGQTWRDPISLNPDRQRNAVGRQLVADGKGNVYALWGAGLRTPRSEIIFTRSEDHGATWAEPISLYQAAELHTPWLIRDPTGTLYAVLPHGPEGNWSLAVARSSDRGKNWERLPTLTAALGGNTYMGIRMANVVADHLGELHVVWEEKDRPATERIYYSRFTPESGDGGGWLSRPIQLSAGRPDSSGAYRPRISIDREGHLFVVWTESWLPSGLREGRHPQSVYFTTSNDYGRTWLPHPVQLSQSGPGSVSAVATDVEVASNGKGQVYVVWREDEGFPPIERVMFVASPDYGSTWTPEPRRLYQSPPKLFMVGSFSLRAGGLDQVYLVWQMAGTAWRPLFMASGDRGATWPSTPTSLAHLPQLDVGGRNISFEADGPALYAAWDGGRKEQRDIFVNRSLDSGLTWLPTELQVTRR